MVDLPEERLRVMLRPTLETMGQTWLKLRKFQSRDEKPLTFLNMGPWEDRMRGVEADIGDNGKGMPEITEISVQR
jgi:hypothetical protein